MREDLNIILDANYYCGRRHALDDLRAKLLDRQSDVNPFASEFAKGMDAALEVAIMIVDSMIDELVTE